MRVLERLHIRNLAVVAELEVEFGPGLNVVTGETGAGKSLVLGALQLLLGERASPAAIRQGAAQCEIAAVLRAGPRERAAGRALAQFLAANSLEPAEDGELILRRVLNPSGTRHFVNGTPVTLNLLRELGDLLVDIHGPHDHQSLLQPRCQLALLDSFAALDDDRDAVAAAWAAAEEARCELERLRSENLAPREIELLRHQCAEIEAAGVQPGEDAELGARHALVAHQRQLLELAGQCRQGLTEGEAAAVDTLRTILRLAAEIEGIDPAGGAPLRARLETLIENAEELSADLARYADGLSLDEDELARLEERLAVLQRLRRRYGPTLEDVLRSAVDARTRLERVDGRQARIAEQERACAERATAHGRLCARLSAARRAAAERLAAAITGKLRRLGFAQGTFAVQLADAPPGSRGADAAEFAFAPNPGEALLPLRQIASSGEIARVMLAIKTILSAADRVPILVFDEVDANIGGRVAVKVAEELVAIARQHQVLCITHLPQIAAAGRRHFRVAKDVENGRTQARMEPLSGAAREEEIIRMLGSDAGSAVAREHARELLAQASQGRPLGSNE
jgi:DNA repair protein RecN (Recombination protein N)